MNLNEIKEKIGFDVKDSVYNEQIIHYINIKLASLGQPIYSGAQQSQFIELAQGVIKNLREKNKLLSNYYPPVDQRIQAFLDNYFSDITGLPKLSLPTKTFILDRYGLARVLSLPPEKDDFKSEYINSYRIKQGVLHNPASDRRTTAGVFHVAEGGLSIPNDKKAVPKLTSYLLLLNAFNPPKDLMKLPFTSTQKEQAELFVSLLLRPIVVPEVPGVTEAKSMEVRFFVPGNFVSNLDFVESIFGNAGDPFLPENDAALDFDHWTGTTGCVILAPHLTKLTKKSLGLPHWDNATERQRKDGMCYKDENELYNDGQAFKITLRTDDGIIVTVIADNYFGYCKKEVKTQISFSANLIGNVEEEHAGGALVFPSYQLGDEFYDDNQFIKNNTTFEENIKLHSSFMDINHDDGYAIDKNYPKIWYVPENAKFSIITQSITWNWKGKDVTIKLRPDHVYILPSGYKIRCEKNPYIPSWRLVGTVAEGTFCHKPSTVSGGGKSEISKCIGNSILYGPFFIADFENDMKKVDEIINYDYSKRYKIPLPNKVGHISRKLLSPDRSLGSVIKMLTPSPDFTDEYNEWLNSIPNYIKGIVFIIKRLYKPEWEQNWKDYFSVDIVNGEFGHELKYNQRKIIASYLRVGLLKDRTWRTFKLRQDFIPSDKIQMEDDITASIVLPANYFENLNTAYKHNSIKIAQNCEYRFFQRPDEVIYRGYDKQAEKDISSPNTFISNFEPLTIEDAKRMLDDIIGFENFSEPMKQFIKKFVEEPDTTYFVSSDHPRIVNGKPSKNLRYLQNRQDIINPIDKYIAEVGVRLHRKIGDKQPVIFPVNAVLPGKLNNPPDPKNNHRPLAVYNPIHYFELPELFMDFVCSLTGKSPSTTGAGSEGALTKGPFNALLPIYDLNNALVSYILTGYNVFTSSTGYIGPKFKVEHDISLFIPEIWSRLTPEERDPKFLISEGHFEKVNDFEHNGKLVKASVLGYRMTSKFVRNFFGRVFENPEVVFSEEMLKPELQDMDVFVDGVNNIVESMQRVALNYFEDGSINYAVTPLKALLHIMAYGNYEGKTLDDEEIRNMFTYEYMINSEWYKERLLAKQLYDIEFTKKQVTYMQNFFKSNLYDNQTDELKLAEKIEKAKEKLTYYKTPEYLKSLVGTIGRDPNCIK